MSWRLVASDTATTCPLNKHYGYVKHASGSGGYLKNSNDQYCWACRSDEFTRSLPITFYLQENVMPTKLEIILDKIKALEEELFEELQKQQEEFSYTIQKRRIHFEESVILRQKEYATQLLSYLRDVPIKYLLGAPFIWMCIVPVLLLDITASLYHLICFPIYKIPKVKRQDYIVFDTQYLHYLNIFEKINCAYCSYVNGLLGYLQEIAARTEQFWCPIKHAKCIKNCHSRYCKFVNYGDAKQYHLQIKTLRHDFKDLE
jgi:hypothetical protein